MNRILAAAAGAALLTIGAADLSAQQTRNGTATITIPEILVFEATNTSVTFAAPTAVDFDATYKAAAATTVLTHKANVRHSITIQADQPSFTATNPVPATEGGPVNQAATKPAADLLWSKNGTDFTGLTTIAATIVSKTAASGTAATQTISYRIALAWTQDTPGTYVLPFRYVMFAD
jgi:hypothetical protein